MDGKTEDTIARPEAAAQEKESLGSFALFVLKLALAVMIFRSFFFSPFSIPSESMLPRLWNGDYLIASKWPYGFTRYSLPFNLPLIPGRIMASQPERGDVVIFKHPIDGSDYIKRVIALPGDTVELRDGQIILNGKPVDKKRVEDFVIPVSPNTECAWGAVEGRDIEGEAVCRYKQFEETLPSGKTYRVLDFGQTPADNYGPAIVPEGRMFLLGDNRDNSQDSRFPAAPAGGIGLVPQDNLVGKASVVMWSTDGGAEWVNPLSWFSAARWDRMTDGI
ncbi:signal peptidase I [Altererythrobacter arenosus]|uniref:Signal peptidase I n=1 Tax=Altererythrobacter arenosus TaxID=3032592 RepID=A0ABY8FQJ4_9SPHN|nr:signal peptidase I [Altererythrobacter sp. CAU 1644]WFL77288.1 signal peptidase I [Altererythrobacter sp. CAU 1644]